MKYLKLFEEYTISKIHKNAKGDFKYCDGVMYKLGNETNTREVSINDVEFTQENTFYPEQIEKYKEYILNGGRIETFPVEEVNKGDVYTLEDMFEYFDDPDNFDEFYDNFHNNKFLYHLNSNLFTLFDIDEYPQYTRIINRARVLEDIFPKEGRTAKELILMAKLKPIFDYFDENKSYVLIDFNHRFAALKELGKKYVLVEIM